MNLNVHLNNLLSYNLYNLSFYGNFIKTKFEGLFEDRYNRYWNNCVVPSDAAIRKNLGFFRSNPYVGATLIAEYVQHVMNILTGLTKNPLIGSIDQANRRNFSKS